MRDSLPLRQYDKSPTVKPSPVITGRDPSFSAQYAGPFFDTSEEKIPPTKNSPKKTPEKKENKEWTQWNKNITLTFDDSSAYILNIASFLEKNDCKNYRFYINAGEDLNLDFLKKIGVNKNGTKMIDKSKTGTWFRFITREAKKEKISTTDYLRKHAIKNQSLENGQKIKEYFQKEYLKDWQKRLGEVIQYHAGVMHPEGKSEYHIQNWTEEQVKEDIKFFEEYVKATFGLKEYKISHMRLPGGWGAVRKHPSYPKFAKIAGDLNCTLDYWDAEWNPQNPIETGNGDKKNAADKVVKAGKTKETTLLLMHTRHYKDPNEIKNYLVPMMNAITDSYSTQKQAIPDAP